jgi:hypothetical protein
MNAVSSFFRIAVAGWLAVGTTVYSQTVPVWDNLWRLVNQEDTDGDRKITVHDQLTPFEIQAENGTVISTLTNVFHTFGFIAGIETGR